MKIAASSFIVMLMILPCRDCHRQRQPHSGCLPGNLCHNGLPTGLHSQPLKPPPTCRTQDPRTLK
eukprot:scaffold105495_cov40-Prasinocladus_malaysianus.AAC.1